MTTKFIITLEEYEPDQKPLEEAQRMLRDMVRACPKFREFLRTLGEKKAGKK